MLILIVSISLALIWLVWAFYDTEIKALEKTGNLNVKPISTEK